MSHISARCGRVNFIVVNVTGRTLTVTLLLPHSCSNPGEIGPIIVAIKLIEVGVGVETRHKTHKTHKLVLSLLFVVKFNLSSSNFSKQRARISTK